VKPISASAKAIADAFQKQAAEKWSGPDNKQIPPTGARKTYAALTGKKKG
jgi:hypothetical protein